MKPKPKIEKPPIMTLTLNWSGDIPKKLQKKWQAMFKPKSVTFKIPKG